MGGAEIAGRVGPAQTSGTNKPERPQPFLSADASPHHRRLVQFLPPALLIPSPHFCLSQWHPPQTPAPGAPLSPPLQTFHSLQSQLTIPCPCTLTLQALRQCSPDLPQQCLSLPHPRDLMLLGLHSGDPKYMLVPHKCALVLTNSLRFRLARFKSQQLHFLIEFVCYIGSTVELQCCVSFRCIVK